MVQPAQNRRLDNSTMFGEVMAGWYRLDQLRGRIGNPWSQARMRTTSVVMGPTRFVFELTETAAIGNIENAKTFTNHLRERGCQFALDDFGSGFGSFYYLKIDGDFIRGLGASKTDQLVVEAVVGIAQGLGKKTVAEFVGDTEMTHRLRQSGVDYAQGYHIGVPQPVSDAFAQL